MVLCTSTNKISYIMAEASWKRRLVGDLAWAMGVVPVKRAQDNAKKGSGTITIDPTSLESTKDSGDTLQVTGTDTQFTTQLTVGDKIRPPDTVHGLKVLVVHSDTILTVSALDLPTHFPYPTQSSYYDILQRTRLDVVFRKVLDKLADGGHVGIFPEGGSHDRTDLLPLKIGVSLMAYSFLDEYGSVVPIVPVGLSYFGAHRWRGRAVVEYGRPIYMDPATLQDFQADGLQRRQVCSDLLQQIEIGMRTVLVAAPDYETLQMLHTARRLYQRGLLKAGERQDLSRRFAAGYLALLQQQGKPDQSWLDLQQRIQAYQYELKDLGLRDYQVMALNDKDDDDERDSILSLLQLPYHIVHLLVLLIVAAVPTLMLNLPVGLLADVYAEARRKKALAKSKVKIRGMDVRCTCCLSLAYYLLTLSL